MLEGFNKHVSTFASDVDRAFWVTTGISVLMFLLVVGLMGFFIFRYHHSKVKPEEIRNIKDHLWLEIAWTVIPTILLFVIFYYGYSAFREVRTMPKDAFSVEVLGKRWSWTFIYPNGKQTAELYVPAGENIRLRLHAPINDVLHSFYVPAFRIKEDVVPGRENHLWFNATIPGSYDVQCAEYCGTRHSYMLSKVEVMEKADFDAWYASDKLSPHDKSKPESEGETIYKTLGCASCHSLDGSIIVGPSFKGIYGKTVKVLTKGKPRDVLVDDGYIRDSVKNPSKDIVDGFSDGIMLNFSDQINETQLTEIVDFIKAQSTEQNNTLSTPASVSELNQTSEHNKTSAIVPKTEIKPQPKTMDGATLFSSEGCVGCHSLDGSVRVGPSLKGLYQSRQKVVTNGKLREVAADEGYLHNSIQHPNDDIVEGFSSGIMPPFGKILSEEKIDALVKYLESIK